ncbi:MAG: hypothetical protein WC250_03715 [Candidatus Paceibacterota bacterium]|jgi:hypothetical protein
MAKASSSETTQGFVPIKEVRDGIAVLKNGGLRAILLASSLNFALKSADEQQAIISQFQNFLNSLDFSVQIFIQSRRLDIRPYIALLESRYKEQLSDLMKIQTREYIEFIKNFTENTSIMSKSFFVVIPYTPSVLGSGSKGLLGRKTEKVTPQTSMENFEEDRSQLDQRISVVAQGLTRSGIRVVQLGTEEVIELFYKIFNPGESEKPIQVK